MALTEVARCYDGVASEVRRKFWVTAFALADLLEYTSRPFFGPASAGCPYWLLPMMKTTVFAKSGSVRGDWFVVDASDKTLGRLATQIAHRLKGKHKAIYSPHVDMGDHIVVLNAEKIHVTGRKLTERFIPITRATSAASSRSRWRSSSRSIPSGSSRSR